MTEWRQWIVPAAAIVSMMPAAHATQYLTIADAQRLAFPNASGFVAAHVVFTPADVAAIQQRTGQAPRAKGEQVWKAMAGGQVIGYVYLDYVIGKHLVIDYAVAVEPGGRVRRVDILEYRESYGGEVRGASWLQQFVGKTRANPIELEKDIRNISGATMSSRHIAEGVKKVLAIHDTRFR